ncbi:hypothetical protein B0A48_05298 [Cryoendolithus antarcticus]|uniref:Life-span regulatory factor domain-containing protein n=1 Tax=Cryoendolithus antarcticus TaxID=1507870 RepID=A0A1V8TI28_9PEZI|nr:hypothetical protein B0A48_05298 [Cryoendolithus antarcticus]
MPIREQHKRTSSNGLKQLGSNARASRPAPLNKRTSYKQSSPSSSRPSSPAPTRKSTASPPKDITEEEDDMASFLQFCTTCDTQIASPNPNLLYCSEACRRKDSRPSLYTNINSSPGVSPMLRAYNDRQLPDIIPQRSPTIVRPLSSNISEFSLTSHTSHTSYWDDDVSPTEKSHSVQDLPGFPSADIALESAPHAPGRPSIAEIEAPPSLVHSPASSYGTIASTPATRPLPPRRATTTAKSMDLVTCKLAATSVGPGGLKSEASTITSIHTVGTERSSPRAAGERRPSGWNVTTAVGSLEQLSNSAAARGVP